MRHQAIVGLLQRIEAKVDSLLAVDVSRRAATAKRRQHYKEAKDMRERGKIPLPTFHILLKRDGRIADKALPWARVGMRFGKSAATADGFLQWLVHQWNSCTYLKKPITFSGNYFRVHTGSIRYHFGPFDLMGLNGKKKLVIRNPGDACDFRERPWWSWAFNVLFPVWEVMRELPGFDSLQPRFCKGLRLVLGGFGMYEVSPDYFFDPNEESAEKLNRMLRRVGPDLRAAWRACCRGLRVHTEPPIPT